jgi:hypothetical protein
MTTGPGRASRAQATVGRATDRADRRAIDHLPVGHRRIGHRPLTHRPTDRASLTTSARTGHRPTGPAMTGHLLMGRATTGLARTDRVTTDRARTHRAVAGPPTIGHAPTDPLTIDPARTGMPAGLHMVIGPAMAVGTRDARGKIGRRYIRIAGIAHHASPAKALHRIGRPPSTRTVPTLPVLTATGRVGHRSMRGGLIRHDPRTRLSRDTSHRSTETRWSARGRS